MTRPACTPIQAALSPCLDGELSVARRAAIAVHLAACPTCRRRYQGLQALHRQLTALPPPLLPPDLNRAILAALPAAARRLAPAARRPADVSGWQALLHVALACTLVLALLLTGEASIEGWQALWLRLWGQGSQVLIGVQATAAQVRSALTAPAAWPGALLAEARGVWSGLLVLARVAAAWGAGHLPLLAGMAVLTAALIWLVLRIWQRQIVSFAEE